MTPGPGGATARWQRLAVWGLIGSIVAVCGFTAWALVSTTRAAAAAAAAGELSDHYEQVATAVAAEESLERKYRLDPSPLTRIRFNEAARDLKTALAGIEERGDAGDRATAAQFRDLHDRYVAEVDGVFTAVDEGQYARARRLDEEHADPLFERLEPIVLQRAAEHRRIARGEMNRMIRLQTRASQQIPVVFVIGLGLAVTSASVLRRYRRQLDAERRRAVSDAQHDRLTGLPNRALLSARLDATVRSRTDSRCGVVLLDLDRFKEINDALGHEFGDRLLVEVGNRLADTVRDGDTVARLGGDEFAVLLPEVDDETAALNIATRLREAAEAPLSLGGLSLGVEASIGVVVGEPGFRDAPALLRRAEVAMYVAKRHKRGVSVYSPDEDQRDPHRLALLGDLRGAMDRRELVLHYQPKVELLSGQVCGVEALVRWNHPERGFIAPERFIPLAEQTGLIAPLTRYVLREALVQIRRWIDQGRPMAVSVNLAARNVTDEQLYDDILQAARDHRVPIELLRLELTESAVITEPEIARRLLGRLHAAGVAIALDDFGAGYTSLGQLKDLPISELKIDRGYVAAMTTDASSAIIVGNIVQLAHALGMTTVAEGVEDAATRDALREAGCEAAQGFLFSRPLPADALDDRHPHTSLAAFAAGSS